MSFVFLIAAEVCLLLVSTTQCDSLLIVTRGAAASCRAADTPFCIRPGNRKEGRKQGRKESGGGGDGDPWHHAGINEIIKPTSNGQLPLCTGQDKLITDVFGSNKLRYLQ